MPVQGFSLSLGANPTGKGNAILRSFTGTNRAANTEVSETVPTGFTWELLAVTVSLAQGATQTPQPTLVITDGTNTIFAGLGASSAQNSSVTTRYTWAPGLTLTAGAANTVANAPLPSGLILPAGYVISTSTSGIGANSDYAAPQIYVIQYSSAS